MKVSLTIERLRELLRYDPISGEFVWLVDRGAQGNGARSGSVAGYAAADGYVRLSIDYRRYLAHRLAWLYMTGAWPVEQIDHRNRRKADNRWENLRAASPGEQNINKLRRRTERELPRGVQRNGTGFSAKISINRRQVFLGYFRTVEEASDAYLAAARGRSGDFLP